MGENWLLPTAVEGTPLTTEQILTTVGIPIVVALTGCIGVLFRLLMKQNEKFEAILRETTVALAQVKDRFERCKRCPHNERGNGGNGGNSS